jgi:hypothetical protein
MVAGGIPVTIAAPGKRSHGVVQPSRAHATTIAACIVAPLVTPPPNPFQERGREIADAAAAQLEAAIPGARRGTVRKLAGADAVHVQFRDFELPQQLAVWVFPSEAGSRSSVPGAPDAIGVAIRHDGGQELGRGAWRFRRLLPFSWRQHIDARVEGYRWYCPLADLPADAAAAGAVIGDRVLRTLRAARAVADE